MEDVRKQAYWFLLCAAMLHLKWDLASFGAGSSPWRLIIGTRQVRKAARRAVAFHNLAIFASLDFAGFREDPFWQEIDAFQARYPNDPADYRRMFERKLAGQEVFITKPGG
jgi:hypothetical protein